MSDELFKIPEMSKTLTLPVDSAIGQRVRIEIGEILGLCWTGFWTILKTAKGQFEMRCDQTSLCHWEVLVQLDITLTGEGQTPEQNFKNDVTFSPKTKLWKMEQFERGRKYNKIELKVTWKSSIGLDVPTHIDFGKKNTWLDVMIRSDDGSEKLFANSGILAMNSPVLRKQFGEGSSTDIIVPLNSFPALKKLMQYLHPPFDMEKEHVEQVLELVSEWEMDSVLKKYEEFLVKNRAFGMEASVQNIKLAEKFKLSNLLEEILWNDSSSVYSLLEMSTFNTWTRAAMFEFLLEIEDENFPDEDDVDDGNQNHRESDDGWHSESEDQDNSSDDIELFPEAIRIPRHRRVRRGN